MTKSGKGTQSTFQYDAFISYASEDKTYAFKICDYLESRGLKCWIAPRNVRPSREYAEEILLGIEHSRTMVLVLSDAANASPFVSREIERAVSHRKPIFPFRIEDVLPSPSLELLISTNHWIDAWQGSLLDHVDRLVEELLAWQNEVFIHSIKDLSWFDKCVRIFHRNLKSILVFIVIVVLLGLVWFGQNEGEVNSRPDSSRNTKPESNSSAPIKFSEVTELDIKPLIKFHPQFIWTINLTPSASLRDQIFDATIKVENVEQLVQQGLMAGITELPVPDASEIEISIRDREGNEIGPFKYDYDFKKDAQEFLSSLTVDDFEIKTKYQGHGRWEVEPRYLNGYLNNTSREFSFDGKNWQQMSLLRVIIESTQDISKIEKLYMKIIHATSASESNELEFDLDLVSLGESQLLKEIKADSRYLTADCEKNLCQFKSKEMPVIKTIKFGPTEKDLRYAAKMDFPLEKDGDATFKREFQKQTYDFPHCTDKVYYRAILIDDTELAILNEDNKRYSQSKCAN
ncbi:toll/interleukin-1 receptor domain-containing protein [Glaciecola sp. 1036]|uniref:toll/interleukin-1 receptor domain-containing protein n=1 Tax=Alteromonadaceae TaxID=72275 RepID=UPI003D061C3B